MALGVLSCCCGAGAAVAMRVLVVDANPITIAAIRFGGGALCLLPFALAARVRWPARADWPAVAALGLSFYAVSSSSTIWLSPTRPSPAGRWRFRRFRS